MNRRYVPAFIVAALGWMAPGAATAGEPCALMAADSAGVVSVRDARTALLNDGRELRLAGIEVAGQGPDALRALVDGQTLRLHRAPGADRYGRLVAYATLPGAVQTVQETLVAQGQALVSARIGDKACAEALFAAERAARAYKDINRLAFKILEPGGVLFTYSCSGGISPDLFHKIVASAGADAGVDGFISERMGGAPDHPMTMTFPEGEYLKGLVVVRKL